MSNGISSIVAKFNAGPLMRKLTAIIKKWSVRHPYIHMKLILLRNWVSSPPLKNLAFNKSENGMTAHALMQLVESKLEGNKQLNNKLKNILYLRESADNE